MSSTKSPQNVTEETVHNLVRLLHRHFRERLASELESAYDTLLGNAVTDVDYKDLIQRFEGLFSATNWTKAPAAAVRTFCKLGKDVNNSEKVKKLQSILADRFLNPVKSEKEIAQGLLEIFTAYELPFVEALIDDNGGYSLTSIELMAAALVEILIDYLIAKRPTAITCNDFVDAVITYKSDESKSGQVKNAAKKGFSNMMHPSPSARTEVELNLRREYKGKPGMKYLVDPRNVICRPLVMDIDDLNRRGEIKNLVEVDFYLSQNHEESKLDKYGFRLNFSKENVTNYTKINENEKYKLLNNFKIKNYKFYLCQLDDTKRRRLLTQMDTLTIADITGTSEKLENLLGQVLTLVGKMGVKIASTDKTIINSNLELENVNATYEQVGTETRQEITNKNIKVSNSTIVFSQRD